MNSVNMLEWPGKTIKTIHQDVYGATLCVLFTDGTYTKLTAESDQDGYVELRIKYRLEEFTDEEKIVMGILTAEQIEKRNRQIEEQQQKSALEWKRKQYEQLKLELGE